LKFNKKIFIIEQGGLTMTTANSISGSSYNLHQPLFKNSQIGNLGQRNVEPGDQRGCPNWLKISKYIPVVSIVMMVPALWLFSIACKQNKNYENLVRDRERLEDTKTRVIATWFLAILPVIGNLVAFVWDRSSQNRNK